jgi:hypothetical protein
VIRLSRLTRLRRTQETPAAAFNDAMFLGKCVSNRCERNCTDVTIFRVLLLLLRRTCGVPPGLYSTQLADASGGARAHHLSFGEPTEEWNDVRMYKLPLNRTISGISLPNCEQQISMTPWGYKTGGAVNPHCRSAAFFIFLTPRRVCGKCICSDAKGREGWAEAGAGFRTSA